jgi:hypothetical protein
MEMNAYFHLGNDVQVKPEEGISYLAIAISDRNGDQMTLFLHDAAVARALASAAGSLAERLEALPNG